MGDYCDYSLHLMLKAIQIISREQEKRLITDFKISITIQGYPHC